MKAAASTPAPDRSMQAISNRTAITGIGATAFTRSADRTVLALATEAGLRAVDDAGLRTSDIDGVVSFFHNQDTIAPRQLVQALGLEDCSFQVMSALGGGWACAAVATASMAIHAGLCRNVLVYRAMRGRSERNPPARIAAGEEQWSRPFGISHAAARFGPHVTAHMARYGTSSRDFGHLAVTQRGHARLNRKAMMTDPMTIDDHQDSPWLIHPFRLLDCCIRSDGAVALVVSAADHARDTRHGPVHIRAVMGGSLGNQHGTLHAGGLWEMYGHRAAGKLYDGGGLTAADVDVAQLYDPCTGICLMHMEAFGLAAPGEAAARVRAGDTGLDGPIPVNTHGGLLSEAYMHGLGHVAEAVQQLRPGGVVDDWCDGAHDYDRAHCRQVRDAKIALVCSECGDSSLLLAADR
jgi:acetyl-CoA acetyltransferase